MDENIQQPNILTILVTIFITLSLSAISLDAGTHMWAKMLTATGDGRFACVIAMFTTVIGLFTAFFVAFMITHVTYVLRRRRAMRETNCALT